MKSFDPLDQLLTPRYPAMSSAKLASLFIAAAQKALGVQLPFARHVEQLETIKTELESSKTPTSCSASDGHGLH
ncbi:hypothetical protein [Hydrogenophaga sp. NFH-34]|uniref:hypothetical protein n=1 Tax=Hydrogenophaga sp. NFH-34 TaxID=2744446 RepID=UPI001F1D8841|nr:hypothetical protein [Hydrogenophaga sp. NFH-34]